MMYLRTFMVVFVTVVQATFVFAAASDIETYGRLPAIRPVSIFPEGKHIAYIQRLDRQDYFVVALSGSHELIAIVKADKFKARSTAFATNNQVLFQVSKTNITFGYRGKHEMSGALVYVIDKGKVKYRCRQCLRERYISHSGLVCWQ